MPQEMMKVGGCSIGGDNPVLTIAEIGINHNGDINIAKRLIDCTASATGGHRGRFFSL